MYVHSSVVGNRPITPLIALSGRSTEYMCPCIPYNMLRLTLNINISPKGLSHPQYLPRLNNQSPGPSRRGAEISRSRRTIGALEQGLHRISTLTATIYTQTTVHVAYIRQDDYGKQKHTPRSAGIYTWKGMCGSISPWPPLDGLCKGKFPRNWFIFLSSYFPIFLFGTHSTKLPAGTWALTLGLVPRARRTRRLLG